MHSVGIMGAGSVGLYLGGCLQVAGASVVYVGRPTLLNVLRTTGLRVTDYLGRDQTLAADTLNLSTHVSALAHCDLVLVTVKSAATADVALELAQHLKPGAIVISFQMACAMRKCCALLCRTRLCWRAWCLLTC